jgi:serpin B
VVCFDNVEIPEALWVATSYRFVEAMTQHSAKQTIAHRARAQVTRNEPMTRARLTLIGALGLAFACSSANTGSPAPSDAPEGVELVRSPLARVTDPQVASADLDRFGSDNRDFAFDLYQQIRTQSDNLFYSPYSISVALAMTYAGARGETQREIAEALHFSLAGPTLHGAFNAADLALQGRATELAGDEAERSTGDGFTLELVNAAFLRKDTAFVEDYLDVLAVNYGAGMYRADFTNEPERERLAINRWVEERTRDRIKGLLPDASIDSLVRFVLVNAIYFKASWLVPFDAARTEAAMFHAPAGDVSVQMMRGEGERFVRDDGYSALELPYISPDVRMLFILPDDGLFETIEAGLDRAFFDTVRGELSEHSVDLQVPRFGFEAEFKLQDALKALGMNRAFESGSADLSGLSGDPGEVYIDAVYHKAFIALDERGTEAAAATAVVGRDESARPPAEFILDRPFIFAIYDRPTGQVLFAGRLVDPS